MINFFNVLHGCPFLKLLVGLEPTCHLREPILQTGPFAAQATATIDLYPFVEVVLIVMRSKRGVTS